MDHDWGETPPRPPCPCGNPRCSCERCHGLRFVLVQASYAEHMFPDPTPEQLAGLGEDGQAAVWAHVHERRRAAAGSVYPCKTCNSTAFFRWAGAHWMHGHDAAGCDECIEAFGGSRRARAAVRARAGTAPERKDLDG